MMRSSLAILAMLLVAGCTAQESQQAQTDADTAVAQAQPTIEMACWLAQAADAGFQAYAASASANATVVADEAKAMAGASAICTNPPSDVTQAIVDVLAAYKAIVAATPASAPSGA
jgi:hypothetical protein